MTGPSNHPYQMIPPLLGSHNLPQEEQEAARFVEHGLSNLDSHCGSFEIALWLYRDSRAKFDTYTKSPSGKFVYPSISMIAARAAATAVFLMDEEMEHIKINLNACRTLAALHDAEKRRAATTAFARYFPNFEGPRHSAQHGPKMYGTPDAVAENCAVPNIVIASVLQGDTLISEYKKKPAALPITEESLANLRDVRDRYWTAFVVTGRNTLVPYPQ